MQAKQKAPIGCQPSPRSTAIRQQEYTQPTPVTYECLQCSVYFTVLGIDLSRSVLLQRLEAKRVQALFLRKTKI